LKPRRSSIRSDSSSHRVSSRLNRQAVVRVRNDTQSKSRRKLQDFEQSPLLIVVDLETTGLGHKNPSGARPDGIVQVGLAWHPYQSEYQTWARYCNPGEEFLAGGRAREALGVNGLDEDQVRGFPSASEVSEELRRKLIQLKGTHGAIHLTAFNVDFDRPFLRLAPWSLDYEWSQCLMIEAAQKLGSPTGRIPLWRACQETDVRIEKAHDAESDAKAALLVHEKLLSRGAAPVRPTFAHHPGCDLEWPHSGPCGYYAEGDFYEFG
jgi:DNA polymerase III epsilon subunit-like protein